ncbi:MAG: hypothetical protein LUE63_01580, partial [Lachnospiraceae bacterium]|nr:hypothetical protein [Lachnospiraceae bacterium]
PMGSLSYKIGGKSSILAKNQKLFNRILTYITILLFIANILQIRSHLLHIIIKITRNMTHRIAPR